MTKNRESYLYAIVAVLVSPALLGVACDPDVDLGGNPDAGPPSAVADAGPGPVDAGPGAVDAGPGAADAGPGGSGAVEITARDMMFDVFDGSEHTLSFELQIRIDDPTDVPHDVRPQRFELLASDGTPLETYPLGPDAIPLTGRGNGRPDLQRYRWFGTRAKTTVVAPLTRACATDRYPSRLLQETVRVVVRVDGVEHVQEQMVPRGTGGTPPMRPLVLCHEGVRVERQRDPFYSSAFLGLTLRTDGLYDVDLWDDPGASTYTSAPIRSVDPEVRISPMSARFWPSEFPTFRVTMTTYCPGPGCGVGEAMGRWIAGATSPPMQIPGTTGSFWCHEPAPGAMGFAGTETWPPSTLGGGWECRQDMVVGGDGHGIARVTGTTDAGPFAAEMYVGGASWSYREPPLR